MANNGKPIRKRWVSDRRPLKVNVSEAEDTPVEETPEEVVETSTEEVAETPVETVEENKSEAVEVVEEVNVPVEGKKAEKKSSVKEYTEEQLVIMTRENFDKAVAEIKAWKAILKQ